MCSFHTGTQHTSWCDPLIIESCIYIFSHLFPHKWIRIRSLGHPESYTLTKKVNHMKKKTVQIKNLEPVHLNRASQSGDSHAPFTTPFFLVSPHSTWASLRQCRGRLEREGSACQQQVLVCPSGSRQQAGYWCVARRGGLAIWCAMLERLYR